MSDLSVGALEDTNVEEPINEEHEESQESEG